MSWRFISPAFGGGFGDVYDRPLPRGDAIVMFEEIIRLSGVVRLESRVAINERVGTRSSPDGLWRLKNYPTTTGGDHAQTFAAIDQRRAVRSTPGAKGPGWQTKPAEGAESVR